MEDKQNIILFDEFTLENLFKQIVTNVRENRKQIKTTIEDIANTLETSIDVQILSPSISNYMDIMVKNDQMLLKLASTVAKIVTFKKQMNTEGDQVGITAQEKQQLIKQAQEQMMPLLQGINKKIKDDKKIA